jgi:uncharacterized membrane protein YbhN (UPF0104 family)
LKPSRWKRLLPLLGLAVLGLAVWVLGRELQEFSWADLAGYWRGLSLWTLVLAVLATAASLTALSAHDWLALRILGLDRRIRRFQIWMVGFTSFVISMNVGGTFFTGGAVRLRSYSELGLKAGDVGRLVVLCMLFGSCGQMFYAGFMFSVWPMPWPREVANDLPLALGSTRSLGILLLTLATALGAAIILRRQPLRWRRIHVVTPRARHALFGAGLAASEWLLAGAALMVLLPPTPDLATGQVLTIVLLAKMAGLVSHVPGGLGVFEVVVLTMMPASVAKAEVVGALLVFRLIYYVIPLTLAACLLLGKEYWLFKHRRRNRAA